MRIKTAEFTDEELIGELRQQQSQLTKLETQQALILQQQLGCVEMNTDLEMFRVEIEQAKYRVADALDTAWGKIFARHWDKIKSIAYSKFSSNQMDAEDYAQKLTFRMLRAVEGASKKPYLPERGVAFVSYFFHGAQNAPNNAYIDDLRRNANHRKSLNQSLDLLVSEQDDDLTTRGDLVASRSLTPPDLLIMNEILDQFIFTVLTEREYMVVRLREVDGLRVEDTAAKLKEHFGRGSTGTVSGDHDRAKDKAIKHDVYEDRADPLELVARRLSELVGRKTQ